MVGGFGQPSNGGFGANTLQPTQPSFGTSMPSGMSGGAPPLPTSGFGVTPGGFGTSAPTSQDSGGFQMGSTGTPSKRRVVRAKRPQR